MGNVIVKPQYLFVFSFYVFLNYFFGDIRAKKTFPTKKYQKERLTDQF